MELGTTAILRGFDEKSLLKKTQETFFLVWIFLISSLGVIDFTAWKNRLLNPLKLKFILIRITLTWYFTYNITLL